MLATISDEAVNSGSVQCPFPNDTFSINLRGEDEPASFHLVTITHGDVIAHFNGTYTEEAESRILTFKSELDELIVNPYTAQYLYQIQRGWVTNSDAFLCTNNGELKVVYDENENFVGFNVICRVDSDVFHQQGIEVSEIAYLVHPDWAGKGIGTAMVEHIIRDTLSKAGTSGTQMVLLRIDWNNLVSLKLAKRLVRIFSTDAADGDESIFGCEITPPQCEVSPLGKLAQQLGIEKGEHFFFFLKG